MSEEEVKRAFCMSKIGWSNTPLLHFAVHEKSQKVGEYKILLIILFVITGVNMVKIFITT